MPVLETEFDPRFCCPHEWEAFDVSAPLEQYCIHCPASCVRDSAGAIAEYDATGAPVAEAS